MKPDETTQAAGRPEGLPSVDSLARAALAQRELAVYWQRQARYLWEVAEDRLRLIAEASQRCVVLEARCAELGRRWKEALVFGALAGLCIGFHFGLLIGKLPMTLSVGERVYGWLRWGMP